MRKKLGRHQNASCFLTIFLGGTGTCANKARLGDHDWLKRVRISVIGHRRRRVHLDALSPFKSMRGAYDRNDGF